MCCSHASFPPPGVARRRVSSSISQSVCAQHRTARQRSPQPQRSNLLTLQLFASAVAEVPRPLLCMNRAPGACASRLHESPLPGCSAPCSSLPRIPHLLTDVQPRSPPMDLHPFPCRCAPQATSKAAPIPSIRRTTCSMRSLPSVDEPTPSPWDRTFHPVPCCTCGFNMFTPRLVGHRRRGGDARTEDTTVRQRLDHTSRTRGPRMCMPRLEAHTHTRHDNDSTVSGTHLQHAQPVVLGHLLPGGPA